MRVRAGEQAGSTGAEGARRALRDAEFYLSELRGLDFPEAAVQEYLDGAAEAADGAESEDPLALAAAQVREGLHRLQPGEPPLAPDEAAFAPLRAELLDLTNWCARGRPGLQPGDKVAVAALAHLRGVRLGGEGEGVADNVGAAVDADAPSSIVFDWLGDAISSDQKRALAPSLEKVAQAGVQSILWNAVILAVIFLTLINFAGGH